MTTNWIGCTIVTRQWCIFVNNIINHLSIHKLHRNCNWILILNTQRRTMIIRLFCRENDFWIWAHLECWKQAPSEKQNRNNKSSLNASKFEKILFKFGKIFKAMINLPPDHLDRGNNCGLVDMGTTVNCRHWTGAAEGNPRTTLGTCARWPSWIDLKNNKYCKFWNIEQEFKTYKCNCSFALTASILNFELQQNSTSVQ